MDLTHDLVIVQGILLGIVRKTGEFTKINHKGGNEDKILTIVMEMEACLSSKNYIRDNKINEEYLKNVEDIVLFFILNTKFNNDFHLEKYAHLINIMPQLSKCVLVHIVYGLDLCKALANVLINLPVKITVEIIEQILMCLNKSDPKVQLTYSTMFLNSTVDILSSNSLTKMDEDYIEQLNKLTYTMMVNLTGLPPDKIQNWKRSDIHEHMGNSLLNLFNLLSKCNRNNALQEKFIKNILSTCCSLIGNITLDVFVTWAEVKLEEQSLQEAISTKAYLIIEDFNKYKPASQMVSMLGTMARKPKSLSEQIFEADIETIIKKINKQDADQERWYKALLNRHFVKNKDAIECVNTWAHLCKEDDVIRLLNLTTLSDESDINKIAIKCIAFLDTQKLIFVAVRHFYQNGFKKNLNDNVHQQLVILFNKLGGDGDGDGFMKDVVLLLMQNPKAVLKFIYEECVKNIYYTTSLKDLFASIKELAQIENIGLNIFHEILKEYKPSSQNLPQYIQLLNTLLEIKYFSNITVINKIILSLINEEAQGNMSDFNVNLQLCSALKLKVEVHENSKEFIVTLLNIMNSQRCTFLEFDNIKQDNVKNVVNIIKNQCDVSTDGYEVHTKSEDIFVKFYEDYLNYKLGIQTILNYLFETFDTDNNSECVTKLIQVLPKCVTSEWLEIAKEIDIKSGPCNTIELLSDVLILLCHLVKSQEGGHEDLLNPIHSALKHCIHNYGQVLQHIMQRQSDLEIDVCVAKNICRALEKFPDKFKSEDGLSLINIINESALKSLVNNEDFVKQMLAIKHTQICQTLSQKMIQKK